MSAGFAYLLERLRARRANGSLEDRAGPTDIELEFIENSLRVHYQPLVDLHTHQIFAYEALARSTSKRFAGPPEMFHAAIEAGVCGELGRALRQITVDNSPPVTLFINVNPNEFDEAWLVRPDDPIFWHGEPVYLEITESVPLSHFELCHSVLREIRGKGVFLAVDDLGAGYSNLKYIADLTPDVVKLDRDLVAGLCKESRQQLLVKQLVKLCTEMGARVVAEGIETIDELHAVQDAGVHYGQGFLLARPAFPAPPVIWPGAR